MTDPAGFLCIAFLGLAAAVVLGFVINHFIVKADEARKARLAAWAAENDWEYIPRLSGDGTGCLTAPVSVFDSFLEAHGHPFLRRFEGFEPFGKGHSQQVCDLFIKDDGQRQWYCFGYQHCEGSGKHKTTYRSLIWAVRVPMLFRRLVMKPEGFGTRLMSLVGLRDLQFESPDFNNKYRIWCQDEKFAYDIIQAEVMDYLMRFEPRTWQFEREYVVVWESIWPVEPHHVVRVQTEIEGLLERIPEFVREDIGFNARWGHPLE